MQEKTFYKHKIRNLLNVQKIVTIHYQELLKGYVSAEEAHDFWEIVYADKGEAYIVEEGEKYLLRAGVAAFLKPNSAHFVACERGDANLFIISFECRAESMNFFAGKRLTVSEEHRFLLQTVMTEGMETFRIPDFDPDLNKLELLSSPNLGGEQVIQNSLELFLIYLLRQAQANESSKTFFVSKIEGSTDLADAIIRDLSDHVYEPFSLDSLCERLHYGKTHLCTTFKRATGNTVYRTFLRMKISEAKKLIRQNLPLSEIADRLRFDSLPHFVSTFKKMTGKTPKEYKISIKR